MSEQSTDDIERFAEGFGVDYLEWVDDDGTKYRRQFVDGEIKDVPVGVER
jgi:hypothetical protein